MTTFEPDTSALGTDEFGGIKPLWKADSEVWREIDGHRERYSIRHLKCEGNAFDAIVKREKTAEFRQSDRSYRVGDVLVMHKLNSRGVVEEFSPLHAVEVTHVQRNFGIPAGYVMLSIKTFNLDNDVLRKKNF